MPSPRTLGAPWFVAIHIGKWGLFCTKKTAAAKRIVAAAEKVIPDVESSAALTINKSASRRSLPEDESTQGSIVHSQAAAAFEGLAHVRR